MFEKLEIYQRALSLAEDIARFCDEFPSKQRTIVDQLKRASLSIPLNIAEGNGKWHKLERKKFFLIARGSVFECVPLVDICGRLRLISSEKEQAWRQELIVISKMISGLIKNNESRD